MAGLSMHELDSSTEGVIADARVRLTSIDALRGLVIVLMALDHARDFFHVGAMGASPTDLATTTPALFLTRWITHLCAPVFALVAGLGAGLRLQRPGETPAAVARYLWTRGLWLILLEVTVMRLGLTFSLSLAWPVLLLVLWMLGLSMVVLAALVRVPSRVLLPASLAIIVLHNVLDGVRASDLGTLAPVWTLLHVPGAVVAGGIVFIVGYPLIPWVAVVAAGFAMRTLYQRSASERLRVLTRAGWLLIASFVVLRLINGYGDPLPWSRQATPVLTLLSFLGTTKYPASLMFLCMTIGPALLLLAWLERRSLPQVHPLVVLGRVPLFFYVSHFWALHAMAAVAALLRYGTEAGGFLSAPFPSMGGPAALFPRGFGYPLPVTYLAWVGVVLLLWPACRWLARRKAHHPAWWQAYL